MSTPNAGADAPRANHVRNTGGCKGGTVTQASFVNNKHVVSK